MGNIVLALQRSITSLRYGRVWLYILGPGIAAFVLMILLSVMLLGQLTDSLLVQPPMSWLVAWGAVWVAHILAALGGWMLIMASCYLIAMLLTGIFMLPVLLQFLAKTEYDDLAQMGRDNFIASTHNSLAAAVIFVVGWLVTLPLWLIPGVALVLPVVWMAWLNRRTFAYDALAIHAAESEWQYLRKHNAGELFGLGLVVSLLTYVPILGLIAPSFAALAYIHYCLASLRELRQGSVVSIQHSERA